MSVVEMRVERLKKAVAREWRRTLFQAGMSVPEDQLQRALDLLVPGVCQYLTAEAKLKSYESKRKI
jgi:hypothetical protein